MNTGSDGNVSFTGHSLGGGMASAASVVTGKPATTFNAAGLSSQTVDGYPQNQAPVDAYYTQGEPLSTLQDNRAGVLATGVGAATVANPLAGAAAGGTVIGREISGQPILPKAYGTRHELPQVPPPGGAPPASGIKGMAAHEIALHGMDYVERGLNAKQKQCGCL